jgi:hypothetical protein
VVAKERRSRDVMVATGDRNAPGNQNHG